MSFSQSAKVSIAMTQKQVKREMEENPSQIVSNTSLGYART